MEGIGSLMFVPGQTNSGYTKLSTESLVWHTNRLIGALARSLLCLVVGKPITNLQLKYDPKSSEKTQLRPLNNSAFWQTTQLYDIILITIENSRFYAAM
jgi:hypothetical protein